MHKQRLILNIPEFFNPVVLFSITLFAINNIWLKSYYGNWLTGKISDITFCFFFPLYLSALASLVFKFDLKTRIRIGALITFFLFSAVKLSTSSSDLLNGIVSPVSEYLFNGDSINRVDPNDLIALPFIIIAMWFGNRYYTYKGDSQ